LTQRLDLLQLLAAFVVDFLFEGHSDVRSAAANPRLYKPRRDEPMR